MPTLKPLYAAGIIPAYAGNTVYGENMQLKVMDHPRVCGEHRKCFTHGAMYRGSSPRMRGTPHRTPHRPDGRQDHPRVCGEHYAIKDSMADYTGSSPRMRGTHRRRSGQRHCKGIIPAYAGNTWWNVAPVVASRDHPRVCGEHSQFAEIPSPLQGSSPRMRGTRGKNNLSRQLSGIIPAYAGNTHFS